MFQVYPGGFPAQFSIALRGLHGQQTWFYTVWACALSLGLVPPQMWIHRKRCAHICGNSLRGLVSYQMAVVPGRGAAKLGRKMLFSGPENKSEKQSPSCARGIQSRFECGIIFRFQITGRCPAKRQNAEVINFQALSWAWCLRWPQACMQNP